MPDADPPSDDFERPADEAFALLGDETRLSILRALWAAHDPGPNPDPVSFSTLRDDVGAEDSGGFNYHLRKLEGTFVRGTDDGYVLRQAGYAVVRAVLTGGITGASSFGPTEVSVECPFCGSAVTARYRDEVLVVQCTNCRGLAADEYDDGTITARAFPPAGVAERGPDAAVRASISWILNRSRAMNAGLCPECAAETDRSISVCADHDATEGLCERCQSRNLVWTRVTCRHCKFTGRYPVYFGVLDQPAVSHFLYRNGVDLHRGLTWETLANVADVDEHLRAEEPMELALTFAVDSEFVTVVVDEHLDVVGVETP